MNANTKTQCAHSYPDKAERRPGGIAGAQPPANFWDPSPGSSA